MTDHETRAELERIDSAYMKLWDELIMCQRGLPPDSLQEVDVLRLLAELSLRDRESQRALREIVKAQNPFRHSAINAFRLGYCDGMDAMQQLAKNACKEV